MSVTIKDVARACGMSISTVSKVFNGYPDISEVTRRQVMDAAHQIGYKPNALARALKTNRSYNLGVLFMDENYSGLLHPFFAAVLNAFKAEAERHGYDITFINHNIGSMEMTYLDHCRYRNVDGVCLACVDFYSREVEELVNSDIAFVAIDHVFKDRPSVMSDNVRGIRELMNHAVEKGHKRIAYIHGQRNSEVTENRIKSFRQTMQDYGLEVPKGYVSAARYDDSGSVRKCLTQLLERPDRPTCVLLPDDASYFCAMDVVRERGMRIPEDISLMGYDGIPSVQTVTPRLTTMRQDSEAMGREAAIRLIDSIDHPNTASVEPVMIPPLFVEGESLGSPAEV